MSNRRNLLLAPLSWIYSGILSVRHKLFDGGVLHSTEFDIPIICVGNITVGGTGKTPTTEFLVSALSGDYNVAVLSRGYKRKTQGFVIATSTSSFKRIGDEPKQVKLKYPDIPVAVCEKRVEGVRRLLSIHPEINLVILDDAFQHRYIEPWVNIVLMDYNNPIYEDAMLPYGNLRDLPSQLSRANIVLVTKCPDQIRPLDMRIISKNLDLLPYQHLFFAGIESDTPQPLFPSSTPIVLKQGTPAVTLTAIANPKKFLEHVETTFTLVDRFIFPDHYTYKMRDIEALEASLDKLPVDTVVLMTEKDAVKLLGSKRLSEGLRRRMFYIPIRMKFVDGNEGQFRRVLAQYVRENQKHNIAHPQ